MNVSDLVAGYPTRVHDTLQLGTATGFLSVPPVVGKGPSRRLQSNQDDLTGIDFLPTDVPVFAARGTRWSLVAMMGIQGHAVRDTSFPMTDERYWGEDNQHSVLEVSDVTAGTELPASDNGIRDVWAGGFCQVVLNGADTEVNSDFTHMRDISCEDVKYFCKSEAGQGRSMHMLRITVANCWTVLSNIDPDGTHGQLGGHVDTMSVGGFIGRIFEFSGTAVLGPLIFSSLKAEGLYRIGDWKANANEGALIFNAGNLNFRHRPSQGTGIPANVMGGNNQAAQIFNGVKLLGTPVLSMMPADVRLQQGARFDSEASLSEDWAMRAYNASLGVYCGRNHDLKATIYGDTPLHNVATGEYRHPHVTIPYWMERCEFRDKRVDIRVRRPKFVRQKSEFTTTIDGLDVTLDWQGAIGRVQAQEVGFCKGGAMRCNVTGQILWIKAVDGTTITGAAMNGHDFTTATVSTEGAWEFIGGGYKSPVQPLWGTFDGTDKVALSGAPDGLGIGDMIAVSQYRQDFGAAPFIKEIDGNTITLEKPVGFSGDVPLFVWIERDLDMPMSMSLGLGVGDNTGTSGSLETDVAAAMARTGGVWYDPSDAATVFQERSSPSTTAGSGDPVGTIQDKSGTNHGIPATDGQRATLTVSGGITYLDFDSASNNSYIFSNAITFGTASAVFLGIRRQASGTNLVRMMGDNSPGTFGMAWTTNLDAFFGGFTEGTHRVIDPLAGDTDWHVFGWTRDSVGNEATLRVDGVEVDSVAHSQASGTFTPILGGSGGTGAANNILADVTQMIVMEDLPTTAEIISIEAFIAAKNGG